MDTAGSAVATGLPQRRCGGRPRGEQVEVGLFHVGDHEGAVIRAELGNDRPRGSAPRSRLLAPPATRARLFLDAFSGVRATRNPSYTPHSSLNLDRNPQGVKRIVLGVMIHPNQSVSTDKFGC